METILALVGPLWPYLLAGLGVLGALLGVRVNAKRSAKKEIENAQLKRTVENAQHRSAVDEAADRAGGDANRQWLRDHAKR